MRRRMCFLACLLATVSFSQTPTFKTDVNLLSVGVRVTDRRGHDVGGLPVSSFTLLEDGVQQRIAFFAEEKQPVSLGILLDTSSSMRAQGKIEHAKAALRELIAAGHPGDELFYLEFGNKLGDIVELTGDPQPLLTTVSHTAARRSGTALYDAVAVALCRLRNARYKRQALIVVTDGADQHSRLRIEELIRIVQASRAQVYMIGDFSVEENEVYRQRNDMVTLVSGRQIDNPVLVFERLAKESGAECYFPNAPGDLQHAIQAMASQLQTQYTLGYYPKASGKPYRRIQVKIRQRGLKAFTRHGFSTAGAGAYFTMNACAISPQEHPYPYESKLTREGGRLAYHEDFSDPRSGWPFNDSSWYGSNEYHIVRKGGIDLRGEGSVCAYGPWWTDVRTSVSVKPPAATAAEGWTTSPAAGLVFRLNDQGYYALLIGAAPGVHAKLISKRFNAARAMDLMPWTQVDETRPIGAGPWDRLQVECRGDLIVLYVNGREIGKVRDDSFPDRLCRHGPVWPGPRHVPGLGCRRVKN